jgi:two-component system sensor histidine kinase FlrB
MALRARRRTARSDWTPPAAAPAGAGAGGGGEAAAIQALLTSALDAAGVAALAVGADGAIHAATPACEALFHRPPARLRGLSLERLVDLTPAAAEALAVARYAGTRQTVLAEAPGSEGQVVVEWVPGSVAGAGYALLQPNSGGTEASERLRFQSGLVSFVAHDLRDSLASVSSGLHILAAELPDESRLQSVVAQAQKENRRAHLMVEDVLAVSRPGRLTRAELDLAGLLVEAVQRFRPRANARGVQLCEAPMPGVRVMADASGLERAFANIIENALQAMEHGGTLTLAMGLQDRLRPGVLVAIADTGPGINPDIGTHIFEPFITDKDDGTGLGLAIARRVVLDHGGQLDFDSRPGAGTTFYVWLPRLG